jgi:hypothetical protein
MAIHETQFAPSQPGVPSLRSLSRDLTGANSFLSYATIMNLGSQQCYYTSMQVLAIVLIDSLSSPSAFLLPQPPGVKSINTPAGIKNDANSDMDDINSNISEEMSALPYQLLDQTQVYDITNKRLFQGASVSNSTAGTTYNYAASLSSGGLSDWSIASMSGVEGVFGQVPGKPSSYSQALQAYGFKLQPGIVKYHKWTKMVNSQGTSWTDNGDVTATSNGFLTLSIDVSGTATAGWIDDTGKTGTIATFSAGSTIQNSLDGDKTYFAGQSNGYMCTYYYYYGRINGPCIIMYDFNQANCLTNQPPSFLPGILGFYNGFTINSDSVVFDTDNQQAATQQLSAIPKYLSFVPSSFNTYDLTESVYWTSSDPVNAPVSNVPKLHLLTGEDQDPDNTPQFTSQDLTSGIIHWLPGSYGKTVTFTATRFLPNGSTVSGSIDINNNFIFEYAAIHTDAVNIYPVGYTIHGDDLMNYGLYVYVTAHQIDGQFIDITGTANLSTDNPAVNVASDGRVKAASVLPAGTTVTVSVTDTFTMTWNMGFLLPNGTRWFDSCVINIL